MIAGGKKVAVCCYGLMCVRCVNVGVVEALYEPPEFGGLCVECDVHEKLFPFSLLFMYDVFGYLFVLCLYSVDDIL